MPGNSQRRGRRVRPKPTPPSGSGGNRKAGLAGKGPTLPAADRPWHKAYDGPEPLPQRTAWKQEKERRARAERAARSGGRPPAPVADAELLVGRNPVVEALRAGIRATALYLADGIDEDARVRELVRLAGGHGIRPVPVSRDELDRLTDGARHQGVGLQVPPYRYTALPDLLAAAGRSPAAAPLLVALDGVTDPRNLGAVIRSAAAFGGHGVLVPARRAAGVTAAAWRTSAGAAARLPVARVTNLTRALVTCQQAGFLVAGLDADAPAGLYDPPPAGRPERDPASGPLLLVVGSEGRGLSRLVGGTCDLRWAIPMAGPTESLNAGVAAAVALAEVTRRRAAGGRGPGAADGVAGAA